MSVKVMSRVWESSSRAGTELLTLLALADFSNDESESFPSLTVLARKVRLSVRQVCHILDSLEQAGEIHRKRSSGGRNRRTHYVISIPQNCEANNSVVGNSVTENTEFQRQETVKPTSHALNHHRTINKDTGAEAPESFLALDEEPKNPPTKEKKKLTRRGGEAIPAALRPAVSKVVGRINELVGTHYRDDRPETLRNLIARLSEGRTEAECLAVVEGRHAAWSENEKMLEYFRPSTLFAAVHFEDYLQTAQRQGHTNGAGNGNGPGPPKFKDLGNGLVEIDGLKMTRKDYERKYGARAS